MNTAELLCSKFPVLKRILTLGTPVDSNQTCHEILVALKVLLMKEKRYRKVVVKNLLLVYFITAILPIYLLDALEQWYYEKHWSITNPLPRMPENIEFTLTVSVDIFKELATVVILSFASELNITSEVSHYIALTNTLSITIVRELALMLVNHLMTQVRIRRLENANVPKFIRKLAKLISKSAEYLEKRWSKIFRRRRITFRAYTTKLGKYALQYLVRGTLNYLILRFKLFLYNLCLKSSYGFVAYVLAVLSAVIFTYEAIRRERSYERHFEESI